MSVLVNQRYFEAFLLEGVTVWNAFWFSSLNPIFCEGCTFSLYVEIGKPKDLLSHVPFPSSVITLSFFAELTEDLGERDLDPVLLCGLESSLRNGITP